MVDLTIDTCLLLKHQRRDHTGTQLPHMPKSNLKSPLSLHPRPLWLLALTSQSLRFALPSGKEMLVRDELSLLLSLVFLWVGVWLWSKKGLSWPAAALLHKLSSERRILLFSRHVLFLL